MMDLQQGDVVELVGLKNSSDLNGLIGVIFRIRNKDRCYVQLLNLPRKLEVSPQNLRPIGTQDWQLPSKQRKESTSTSSTAVSASDDIADSAASEETMSAKSSPSSSPPLPSPAPKKRLLENPQIQLRQGVAQLAMLRQQMELPYLSDPTNPKNAMNYALFILSVVGSCRGSGITVFAHHEYWEV